MRITIKMMAVVVMVMLVVLVIMTIMMKWMIKMRKVTQQICPGSDIYFPPQI